MEKIKIFDIAIDNIDFQEGVNFIREALESDGLNKIYTPNPEIVMRAKKDRGLVDMINRGDLVTADGIGLVIASRIKKLSLKERVTGYDLSIEMLKLANEKSYSLYLLGAKPGVAEKAIENIKKDYPKIKILGCHHGYFRGPHFGEEENQESKKIIEEIVELGPDILFVGLGFPLQERWIDYYQGRLRTKIAIANGGVIDVLAGEVKRAPEFWQKINLEWFYRLVKEPSRIKRQIIIPKFLLEIIFRKNSVLKEDKNEARI